MIPPVARLVDALLSRGEGLDERGDPFAPALAPDEAARLLALVDGARYREDGPPFASPLPLEGTSASVPVVLRPPPSGAADAWALLLHPYGAFRTPGALGLYALHARALARHGFGVAAPALPFHDARAMPGRPSGWGFVRADLAHTSRAIVAGAAETMALARWLRERRGARRVVGLGISLGGAALGLAAARGAPIDRLAFLAAVDNPAGFYGTGANREARRRTLRANGHGPAEVEAAFRAVAPSTHAPPTAPALWAVPPLDGVVPAPTQRAWAKAWGGAVREVWGHGHGTAIASPLVAARLASWLAR